MNGTGKSATVFDAQTGTVVATIELGGKPEAVVQDRPANRLFVNIEDTGAIAVIDITTHTLVTSWTLAGCEEPTGLGFDPGNHLLFSACANKVMTVTDSLSGKRVTTVPIGDGADGAAFDPVTGYAFASNGADGTVTIAHLDNPRTLTVTQTLPTLRVWADDDSGSRVAQHLRARRQDHAESLGQGTAGARSRHVQGTDVRHAVNGLTRCWSWVLGLES